MTRAERSKAATGGIRLQIGAGGDRHADPARCGASRLRGSPERLQRPVGAGQPYKAAFEARFAGERFEGGGQLGAQECKLAISRAQ